MYCLYFRMCYFGLIIVVLVATNTFIPGTYYAREAFCIACMGFSPGSFLLPNGIFLLSIESCCVASVCERIKNKE